MRARLGAVLMAVTWGLVANVGAQPRPRRAPPPPAPYAQPQRTPPAPSGGPANRRPAPPANNPYRAPNNGNSPQPYSNNNGPQYDPYNPPNNGGYNGNAPAYDPYTDPRQPPPTPPPTQTPYGGYNQGNSNSPQPYSNSNSPPPYTPNNGGYNGNSPPPYNGNGSSPPPPPTYTPNSGSYNQGNSNSPPPYAGNSNSPPPYTPNNGGYNGNYSPPYNGNGSSPPPPPTYTPNNGGYNQGNSNSSPPPYSNNNSPPPYQPNNGGYNGNSPAPPPPTSQPVPSSPPSYNGNGSSPPPPPVNGTSNSNSPAPAPYYPTGNSSSNNGPIPDACVGGIGGYGGSTYGSQAKITWPALPDAYVKLVDVTNGCGPGGPTTDKRYGDDSDFEDSSSPDVVTMSKQYYVNFRNACLMHDAGYSGVKTNNIFTGAVVDFFDHDQKKVDDQFLADMLRMCDEQIPASAKAARENCKGYGGYHFAHGAMTRYRMVQSAGSLVAWKGRPSLSGNWTSNRGGGGWAITQNKRSVTATWTGESSDIRGEFRGTLISKDSWTEVEGFYTIFDKGVPRCQPVSSTWKWYPGNKDAIWVQGPGTLTLQR